MISQTPKEGTKVEKGEPVSILIAVGSGKIDVPNIVGLKLDEAEKALREKSLTLGQASPQPADPEGKISSQIPAEGEIVKAGAPVDIFYPDPASEGEARATRRATARVTERAEAREASEKGGGEGAADIIVPAIAKGDTLDAYAKKLGDLGIVPVVSKQFNDAKPDTPFGTNPPGGTKVATGAKVKVLVSVGQPQIVYTNGKDILRLDGATAAKLDPVSTAPGDDVDPTWTADSERVAYSDDGPRDAQGHHEEELRAGADHARGRALLRPRVGADRGRQPDRHARRPRGRQLGPLHGQHPGQRDRHHVQGRAVVQDHPGAALGARTASRSSASASRCRTPPATSASCAGA